MGGDDKRAADPAGSGFWREVWLEVGFGGAEHMIWQARQNPGVGMIGCEPFEDGVVKALAAIEREGLQNLRIYPGDARSVLRWLPASVVGRVFVLFPDPWPKNRHRKRRLLTRAFVEELARVMTPGAELRFATDVGDYARAVLIGTRQSGKFRWAGECPADRCERTRDWPQTRYERKAIDAGRMVYFLRFNRR